MKCGAKRFKKSDFCIHCGAKFGLISKKSEPQTKTPIPQVNVKSQGFVKSLKNRITRTLINPGWVSTNQG